MTEPTDAEIIALADETRTAEGSASGYILPISFARAVLAKWGQPPQISQPAKLVEPDGRLSDELRNMIEGMSVSVDVSTGDHDAGRRYFGTVTEVMDDISDKYGATLLVQDAEPNFAPTPQPTQAQAGAVPMYRLLQSGVHRIEAADEFLSDDATTWVIDPNGIFVGNIYGGHVLRPARRRIKGGRHGTE